MSSHRYFLSKRVLQTAVPVSLALALSMWCFEFFLFTPYTRAERLRAGEPVGNLSDLYPRWYGAREVLDHGRNPYAPEVTREIQIGYYGRVLDATRPNDPKDQQAFAHPAYVILFLWPFVNLQFSTVQVIVRLILIAATIASLPLWLFALRLRCDMRVGVSLTLLTLSSVAVLQGIWRDQLTLLVAFFVAAAMAAVACGRFGIAGFLLALASIKPQLILVLLLFVVVWSLGAWKKRKLLVLSFAGTLAALVSVGDWLVPGWIRSFLNSAAEYRQYVGTSPFELLLPEPIAQLWATLLLACVAALAWRVRRDESRFSLGLAFALVSTLLVVPSLVTYNHVLALPAIMVLLPRAGLTKRQAGLTKLLWRGTYAIIVLPWLTAMAIVIAGIMAGRASIGGAVLIPAGLANLLPMAVFLLLCAELISELGRNSVEVLPERAFSEPNMHQSAIWLKNE